MRKQYTDKPHFVAKSLYLCRFLQQRGFELKRVKINKFNPKHNVFLFENTAELQQALTEYRKMKEEAGY